MCFGRLTGAATGLEVAREGALEWVEGQMDKQTDRQAPASEMNSRKRSLSGCQAIRLFRKKITLTNINIWN